MYPSVSGIPKYSSIVFLTLKERKVVYRDASVSFTWISSRFTELIFSVLPSACCFHSSCCLEWYHQLVIKARTVGVTCISFLSSMYNMKICKLFYFYFLCICCYLKFKFLSLLCGLVCMCFPASSFYFLPVNCFSVPRRFVWTVRLMLFFPCLHSFVVSSLPTMIEVALCGILNFISC